MRAGMWHCTKVEHGEAHRGGVQRARDDANDRPIAKGSIGSWIGAEIIFGFKGCSVVGAAKATLAIIQLKLIASNERTNM